MREVSCPDKIKVPSPLLLLLELDARAEVPWQSHGTGSALLHEANGDRRRVHPLAESRSPGPEAGQHVPIRPDDRQDWRLRAGDQARRPAQTSVRPNIVCNTKKHSFLTLKILFCLICKYK